MLPVAAGGSASPSASAADSTSRGSVFLAALTGASFLTFLVGYIYLFVKDRESLRTGRGRRAALAAKPAAGARGSVAAGNLAPLSLGEPAVIPVPEGERAAGRRSY